MSKFPPIGLGTWITFNVGSDEKLRAARAQVMQTFFDRGGSLINSSPMYGSSEAVIGYGLARIKNKGALFSAGKVWTLLKPLGVNQMENSRRLWGVERFDLMQVHNLLDWSTHLETLKAMKARGACALHRHHHLPGMALTAISRRSCAASASTSWRSPTTWWTARSRSGFCRSRPSAASRSSSTGHFRRAC